MESHVTRDRILRTGKVEAHGRAGREVATRFDRGNYLNEILAAQRSSALDREWRVWVTVYAATLEETAP